MMRPCLLSATRAAACTAFARIAAFAILVAALCAQPASAQLPGLPQAFPCHVLHVTNQTHNPALVSVNIDPNGSTIGRVGLGMVEACTSADIQLPPNLRCGVTLNVRGEVKDTSKVPVALLKINPAAAPTIADVKGTVTPQNAAEPANWLVLVDAGKGSVAWKPVAAGTKMPAGCPPAAAPGAVTFTFNNGTASPVLVSAGGTQAVFDKVCIGPGQSRSVMTAPSGVYKVVAQPARDAACQQAIGPAVGGGAQPVNGKVTMNYAVTAYSLQQLEKPQPPSPTGDQSTTQVVPGQPAIDTMTTQTVPTGK